MREREREKKKPQRFSSERSLSFCSFRTSKMAARTQRAGTLIRLLGNVRFQNERTSFKALFPYQKVSNIVNNSAFIHLNIYLFYYVCTFYRRKSRVEPTWLDNTACSTPELFAPFIHTLREILSLNTPDVSFNIYIYIYSVFIYVCSIIFRSYSFTFRILYSQSCILNTFYFSITLYVQYFI